MAKDSSCSPKTLTTSFRVEQDTLVIDLGTRRTVLSSAPRGGGIARVRHVLNHHVAGQVMDRPSCASPRQWGDPSRYLTRVAMRVGVEPTCVALMTAVPLKHLVVLREEAEGIWVEAFLTVGLSNAVRAGEPVEAQRSRTSPGTINIILVTNARVAIPAMVEMVQVATESKTVILLAEQVRSCTGQVGATGTGTDAIVIVRGDGPTLRYSGTHTPIGAMVGRLVARGVREGLQQWRRWADRKDGALGRRS